MPQMPLILKFFKNNSFPKKNFKKVKNCDCRVFHAEYDELLDFLNSANTYFRKITGKCRRVTKKCPKLPGYTDLYETFPFETHCPKFSPALSQIARFGGTNLVEWRRRHQITKTFWNNSKMATIYILNKLYASLSNMWGNI